MILFVIPMLKSRKFFISSWMGGRINTIEIAEKKV